MPKFCANELVKLLQKIYSIKIWAALDYDGDFKLETSCVSLLYASCKNNKQMNKNLKKILKRNNIVTLDHKGWHFFTYLLYKNVNTKVCNF